MSLMQLFLRLMIDPARPDSRRRKKDERGFTLTELMVVLRARVGINEILMVAQEAIYRCLTPSCVFVLLD